MGRMIEKNIQDMNSEELVVTYLFRNDLVRQSLDLREAVHEEICEREDAVEMIDWIHHELGVDIGPEVLLD